MTDEAERAAAETAALNRIPGDQRLEKQSEAPATPFSEPVRFQVMKLPLDQFCLVVTRDAALDGQGDPISAAAAVLADFDPGVTIHGGGSFSFMELIVHQPGMPEALRYSAFWNAEAQKWDHAGTLALKPDARRFFDQLCDLANRDPRVLAFGQQFKQTPWRQ